MSGDTMGFGPLLKEIEREREREREEERDD